MSTPSTTAAPVPETGTDTPLTDAVAEWSGDELSYAERAPADFARSLETRLTQSEARERVLREQLKEAVVELNNLAACASLQINQPSREHEDEFEAALDGVEKFIARAALDQTKQP